MITNPTTIYLNIYSYLSTIFKIGFLTDYEIEGAQKVRKLQQDLYWSGTSKFKTSSREGMIRNYLLNTEHSVRANHIYGLDRPILQGGTKHIRKPAEMLPRVTLPTYIFLHHKNIKLYIYIY